MNYSAVGGMMGVVVTVAAFAVLCLITYVCFVLSAKILEVIGEAGLSIITRLMGLILAVLGTQVVIDGVDLATGKVIEQCGSVHESRPT